jgi:hypothetical protein
MAKAKVINHDFEKDGYRTLFLEWLLEWKLEAANMQSRIQYTYANVRLLHFHFYFANVFHSNTQGHSSNGHIIKCVGTLN